jgi:hypothetical protein
VGGHDAELILIAGALLAAGIAGALLADRMRIPGLLIFLALGMLAGSEGIGGIEFNDTELARTLGTIALVLILFEGGLTAGWSEIRPVLGTAAYLSPEQASGHPAGPQADLYALGCVLFEMLTGSPPFTADSEVGVAYRQVHDDPGIRRDVAGLDGAALAIQVKRLAGHHAPDRGRMRRTGRRRADQPVVTGWPRWP